MEREYTYWLPSGLNGERVDFTTQTNSVILVGANGSGKSKLGAWIEKQEIGRAHRIGAQRNINISPHIQLKSYKDASSMVLFGSTDEIFRTNKMARWGDGSETTKLINDFDDTLAALIALHNNANQEYVDACKECEAQGKPLPDTRETPLNIVLDIWNGIFTARELLYGDGQFSAKVKETGVVYHSREMSDGERSVLYLAAQVCAIPRDDGRVIIMDEPEVHLNRSLLMPLWSKLESVRSDCLFVFITHDVDFVSSHPASDKIWVKGFNGERWDLCPLEKDSSLPEPLLVRLLGGRKPVLFVEGNRSSYDYAVYSAAYPGWYVVPVGGCAQVIESVKAFRAAEVMHSYDVYGIIDRDYRSSEQLEALEIEGIYHLGVAEIENLFLTVPVLQLLARQFAPEKDTDNVVEKVKDYVKWQRFHQQLLKHETNALKLRLKNELAGIELSELSIDDAGSELKTLIEGLNPDAIAKEIRREFEDVDNHGDYQQVLILLNDKQVAHTVGHFFGIENKQYIYKAVAILSGEQGSQLIDALRPYLPDLQTATDSAVSTSSNS